MSVTADDVYWLREAASRIGEGGDEYLQARLSALADWLGAKLRSGLKPAFYTTRPDVTAEQLDAVAKVFREVWASAPRAQEEEDAEEDAGPLWALHVRGADVFVPTADYEMALRWSDKLNGNDPEGLYRAVPALWPWGVKLHARAVAFAPPPAEEAR